MISGTTVGPIIAPAIVLGLANHYSWQASFIVTGALGFLWLIAWYFLYDRPEKSKRISKEELDYIMMVIHCLLKTIQCLLPSY
jgi:ACS family hexuronate transporter-like MFS transporter